MTPIIFLDIDGVLNCRATAGVRPTSHRFDLDKVALLDAFVRETDADVVISSSWRRHYPLTEIIGFLRERGFTGRVIGVTPILNIAYVPSARGVVQSTEITPEGFHPCERGLEIDHWRNEHERLDDPFLIFDDGLDFTESQQVNHLVRTTFEVGLQPHHILIAHTLLRSQHDLL